MKRLLLICFCMFLPSIFVKALSKDVNVDVLVIGGGTSGVTAGIQCARMGVRTLILSESDWLGGMLTSAGVSAVDGDYRLPAGLWGEFRDSLCVHYGGLKALKTGWVSNVLFEPSVGNTIFHRMVQREHKFLSLYENCRVSLIKPYNKGWKVSFKKADKTTATAYAKIVIDATELGDIAKRCGVGYDIGMESRYDTKENIAPEKKNNIVQDLTYVAILKDYGHDVSMPKPYGYNKDDFVRCCKSGLCPDSLVKTDALSPEMLMSYGQLPNHKYMINWPGFGNDYYVNLIEMTPEMRKKELAKAKQHTLCFVYFIQHELGFKHLGLADDEFPTADKLPLIPYYRESRRIHGLVRFTLNDLAYPYQQKTKLYRTCIAVGDYPVDHHHGCYNGTEKLPDLHFYPVPSYGLPLGTLIPKGVKGLIVAEKSISVSNLVNGTTRLQPVVMQIGQASGILAALSVKSGKNISDISVRKVQNEVLNFKGYLLPYLDVSVGDVRFKSYQRIGATGIMKGVGKSIDWANEMWFNADSLLVVSDLDGLKDYYPKASKLLTQYRPNDYMTIGSAINMVLSLSCKKHIYLYSDHLERIGKKYLLHPFNLNDKIKRGDMAVLIDSILDPFNTFQVDIFGNLIC